MQNVLTWTAESAAESQAVAASGGTNPIFWVIVGLVAVGLLIMFIQNFVLKKEEDYK